MTSISEWKKFAIGQPGTWGRRTLTDVYHVTHVEPALRVLDDGVIKADLVYDESKLNTERIRVVWVSPNDWLAAGGFRYGNVRLVFDWDSLVSNKQFYWVESMAYGINAARILVSDKDHSYSLKSYDPTQGDGPWWFDQTTLTHYWNGEITLEIMIERDLDLTECTAINFADHHARMCCIDPNSCPSLGVKGYSAKTRMWASLGNAVPNISLHFADHSCLGSAISCRMASREFL